MYQKIFLSHSSKDKPYGDAVVALLLKAGLSTDQILYSSNDACGIPIGKNIYDYLRETIQDGAYMVYLLSDHYYDSIACMNEMGAAWMRQNDYLLLATPGFDYSNEKFQKGAANPKSLAVSMDNMDQMRKLVVHVKKIFGIDADSIQMEASLKEYFKTLDEIKRWTREKKTAVVGLEKIVKDTPKKESEFIALGKMLWDKDRNYTAAVQQYLYAILLNENCETAYIRIMEAATQAKEYCDAWKICNEAFHRFPGSARVYGARGYLECAQGRYEDAVKDCTRAIEIKKDRWYSNTRGRALWGLGRVYEALVDFHESCRLDSKYSYAINNIKNLCQIIGVDNVIDTALQKKQETDLNLCRIYLECVLVADEKNERAKKELEMLQI